MPSECEVSGCDAKPPSEQIGYAICPLHQLSQRMPNYRTLKVWQHAQRLALECAKAAKRFPPEDCNVLKMQLLRACYSVPLNIAEGSGRKGPREFRRFLDTARGSLAETQTALELAKEQGFIEPTEYERLEAIATETAKTLWGLLRKISDSAVYPAP